MKSTFYKNLSISLVLIIIWILIGLFTSFVEYKVSEVSLYIYFLQSYIYSVGFGLLALLIRVVSLKWKRVLPKLNSHFIYLLIGVFNLMQFAVWMIVICKNLLKPIGFFDYAILISCPIISAIIITDAKRHSPK